MRDATSMLLWIGACNHGHYYCGATPSPGGYLGHFERAYELMVLLTVQCLPHYCLYPAEYNFQA